MDDELQFILENFEFSHEVAEDVQFIHHINLISCFLTTLLIGDSSFSL